MSIEKVRNYLKLFNRDQEIIELNTIIATVELAAFALAVNNQEIAKTLAFRSDNGCNLIVMAGDVKVDNKKFKDYFGYKARLLSHEETLSFTNHEVGGVCPFAIDNPLVTIYADVSLKKCPYVYPACGNSYSVIKLLPDDLFILSKSVAWIDVTKSQNDASPIE